MEYIRGTIQFQSKEKTAISLGKFDGLHRGHQKLIQCLLNKKPGCKAVIFTFDVPPAAKLYSEQPAMLITNEERAMMAEEMGVDLLIECPFVPEIAKMEPETFVKEILIEKLNVSYLAVGEDFRFGYKRTGDGTLLKTLSKQYGFEVDIVEKEQCEGKEISSTYIKKELAEGNIERARDMLGYAYFISGTVIHGRNMGKKVLGFPTTNLQPKEEKLLPPSGVYASVTVIDGVSYHGITNIGYKPTVGDQNKKGVETFLFDFEKDVYGKEITVKLYTFIRPEMKFEHIDYLKEQMKKDILFSKKFFHIQGNSKVDEHNVQRNQVPRQ